MRLVLDSGNALIKWYAPKSGLGPQSCIHSLAELDDHQWQSIVGRGKTPPSGYFKVNGVPYAIGTVAKEYQTTDRPVGAARYNKGYYGVIAAYTMAQSYSKPSDNVINTFLYSSYAPRDIQYVPELIKAVKRAWNIECQYGKLTFDVKDVVTTDEPLCGYAHYVFTEGGTERVNNPLRDKTVLVIDVGGYTTDKARIYPNGEIDLLSIDSRIAGTNAVKDEFERKLRSKYKNKFQDAGDLDNERLEKAIINGFYQYGNEMLECAEIAKRSIRSLVDDVVQFIKKAGGAANYDAILLTGGGSALIHNELIATLTTIDFILAENNISALKYANVLGGAKIATIFSRKE